MYCGGDRQVHSDIAVCEMLWERHLQDVNRACKRVPSPAWRNWRDCLQEVMPKLNL